MKWLITGGCGFIGTNLIRQLVGEVQHSVRVLDNLSVGDRDDLTRVTSFTETKPSNISEDIKGEVELIVGDVRDSDLIRRVTRGMDIVVHLAAQSGVPSSVENPRHDFEMNTLGTFNVLESARHHNVTRFVFASSAAPIGECEPPIHEDIACNPKAPYGASKLAGEGYCSAYYESFGVDTVVLRFGNVYGPLSSHKSSVVAKFIRRAKRGKPLEVYGDGKQTRDFIYTGDLVRAIRLSAKKRNIGGEKFQIATNSETTINEMAELLVQSLKKELELDEVKLKYTKERKGDIRKSYSDITKAQKKLGWKPQTNIEEGLKKTVRSHKN